MQLCYYYIPSLLKKQIVLFSTIHWSVAHICVVSLRLQSSYKLDILFFLASFPQNLVWYLFLNCLFSNLFILKPKIDIVLIFDRDSIMIKGRQMKLLVTLDLVVIMQLWWGDRNPPPFRVCSVLDDESPVPVHGCVPFHQPLFWLFVLKWCITFSTTGTYCNMHWSGWCSAVVRYIIRPLVGMNVSR